MNLRTLAFAVLLLAGSILPARAQWITQTFALKSGWNAVYLHVDASYATLDQLFGPAAPVRLPIDEVWRWNPAASSQDVSNPQAPAGRRERNGPAGRSPRWARPSSTGSRPTPPTCSAAAADTTLRVKGRPVMPSYQVVARPA
jgi:hypothetical protein